MLKVMLTAARENRFLECIRSYHRAYGQTFEATITGRALIFTVEPRNIHTVLADKFKDFELGDYRKKALLPLLGHGIFASDGENWQRSRALLLPSFVHDQITNVDIYERHVARLIEHIPSDGSMVDLQDLFFRMVIVPFQMLIPYLYQTNSRQDTRFRHRIPFWRVSKLTYRC